MDLFKENRFVYQDDEDAEVQGADGAEDAEAVPGLEAPADAVRAGTEAGLIGVRHEVEAEQHRTEATEERDSLREDLQRDLDEALTNVKKSLDNIRISTARDIDNINAHNWDPTSFAGLETIIKDWKTLQILPDGWVRTPGANDLYNRLFNELSKSYDQDFLGNHVDEQQYYMNPDGYPDVFSPSAQALDSQFYYAWSYFNAVKDVVADQDTNQDLVDKNKDAVDSTGAIETIEDGVKRNIKKFQKAIKERDYATAGVYVIGIYAVWKSYQKLTEGKGGEFAKKWAFYLAAAGAGLYFANAAGYDIVDKLGLKEAWDSVEGTNMESLFLVGVNPEDLEKIDQNVYAKSADINVRQLYKHYQATNVPNGIRYIDPALFPQFADEFRGPDTGKDKKRKEYGESLYWIMYCLEQAYDKTVRIDKDSNYYGVPMGEAFSDGLLQMSTIQHLTDGLNNYSSTKYEEGILDTPLAREMRDRLVSVFEGKEMAFNLDSLPHESGDYVSGSIRGLPVAIVKHEHGYVIFSKRDFLQSQGHPSLVDALATIPFEGSVADKVLELQTNIQNKMNAYLMPITNSGDFQNLAYDPLMGQWACDVTMTGWARYGAPSSTGKAIIDISETGILRVTYVNTGQSFSVDSFSNSQYPQAGYVLSEMSRDPDLSLFAPFYNSGRIEFLEDLSQQTGNPNFKIRVAGEIITVEFDPATNKYAVASAEQERLLKNPKFVSVLVDAILDEPNITEVFDDLKGAISEADESYVIHFFQEFGFAVSKAWDEESLDPLSESHMGSGSIPDYYANYVLKQKKDYLKYRITANIQNQSSFKDASDKYHMIITDTVADLKQTSQSIPVGSEWSHRDFMSEVVEPINSAGISRTYYEALRLVEQEAVKKYGTGNDILERSFEDVSRVMDYYIFFTAGIDGNDLDSVTYPIPANPTPAQADLYKRVAYLRFVKDTLFTKLRGTVPASPQGLVPTFDSFNPTNLDPLYEEDRSGPMSDADISNALLSQLEIIEEEVYSMKYDDLLPNGNMSDEFARMKSQLNIQAAVGEVNTLPSRHAQIMKIRNIISRFLIELMHQDPYWEEVGDAEMLLEYTKQAGHDILTSLEL